MRESYRYNHVIGENQLLKFEGNRGELRLRYDFDSAAYPDLRSAAEAFPSQAESLAAGFYHLSLPADSVHPKPGKAQSILLPSEGLHDKLCRVDSQILEYGYPVSEPKWIPVRIDARIMDESPIRDRNMEYFEAHEFTDNLELILNFRLELPPETIQASLGLQRKFQDIESGRLEARMKHLDPATDRNVQAIGKAIAELASAGGGILTWGIYSASRQAGLEEGEQPILKAACEEAALDLTPPVPVWPYAFKSRDNKDVLMIEVPPLRAPAKDAPKRTSVPEARARQGTAREVRTAYEVESALRGGPSRSLCFLPNAVEELAEIQAGMANGVGGHILFGALSHGLNRPGEIVGFTLEEADNAEASINAKTPLGMPVEKLLRVQAGEKWILVQSIPADLPDVYACNGKFPIYDGERIEYLDRKRAIVLHRERRAGLHERIFTAPQPFLERFSLDWVDFPAHGEYDPETGRLEWKNVAMQEEESGRFSCTLKVRLEQTRELFRQRLVTGHAKVVIPDTLLSGATLEIFDALGRPVKSTVNGSTEFLADMSLNLPGILKRRPYFPIRTMYASGLKPTIERARDVIRALNDSGIILEETPYLDYMTGIGVGIRLVGRKHGDDGVKRILVKLRGRESNLRRELKSGVLTDNKDVDSGLLEITFQAATEDAYQGSSADSHKQIAALFNEIIGNLKNRFDYLKVE